MLFERSLACQEALRDEYNLHNADPNWEEKEQAKELEWIEKRFRDKVGKPEPIAKD